MMSSVGTPTITPNRPHLDQICTIRSVLSQMDRSIDVPDHEKNVIGGLNAMEKRYLKGAMEIIGKLSINDTANIGMLPIASKCVYIKFTDQCLHTLNYK